MCDLRGLDIQPAGRVYETTVYLNYGQTIEHGLGLPSPQIDAEAALVISVILPSRQADSRCCFPVARDGGSAGAKKMASASHHVLFTSWCWRAPLQS